MKLKPSLFQLSVVLMVSSLLASFLTACTHSNTVNRPECQLPTTQRPPDCNYSNSSGSSTIHRSGGAVYQSGGSRKAGQSNVAPGSRKGSSVGGKSTSTGRSGFGSFGRGSSSS